jgi:ubiquinol-cytochrome c reductase cytochrome c subunit
MPQTPATHAKPPAVRAEWPQANEPDDDAALEEAMARRSLEENCLICHSADMVAGQRLTAAQWKAEVDKMVNWGAPLPKQAEASLIDYLARRYSDQAPPVAPPRAALEAAGSLEVPSAGRASSAVTGDVARGQRLYATNCETCHGPTALGADLGPSLVRKAILRYPAEYDQILRQGLRRMPGFRAILNARDRLDVLAWLRQQTN